MGDVFDVFRLIDRTVIVMGIGPGVGEHVAKAYAAAGARVVCAARRTANIERVACEIREAGGEAIAVTADVTLPDDLVRLVAESRRTFGPIHVEAHKGYDFTARNAIKRYGYAREVVGVALLLASDASSYTTEVPFSLKMVGSERSPE